MAARRLQRPMEWGQKKPASEVSSPPERSNTSGDGQAQVRRGDVHRGFLESGGPHAANATSLRPYYQQGFWYGILARPIIIIFFWGKISMGFVERYWEAV